jgi:hypothetical protein
MRVELGHVAPEGASEALAALPLRWKEPSLPELTRGTVRRWRDMATWTPPETTVLCRHRALQSSHRIHSNRREPPTGYMLEFDLGCIRFHAAPGAHRLVTDDERLWVEDDESELPRGQRNLGFVEQAPFPMLDVLELRTLPDTGQPVLVAGEDDPLFDVARPSGVLGWIESFPIQPRRTLLQTGTWGLRTLMRMPEADGWRHRYVVASDEAPPGAVALGGLWHAPARGFVPLRPIGDGRLATELAAPSGPARAAGAARWVSAPLRWTPRPRTWALRASASRARRLAADLVAPAADGRGSAPLGWLRSRPGPGWSPLFSASHPALADQFLTRSELEARDLGFRVDGVLGFIADDGADRGHDKQPPEIRSGSRFGQRRRYLEGPANGA